MNFLSLLDDKNPYLAEPKVEEKMSKLENLQMEKELLGFYLSGHPLEEYQDIIKKVGAVSIKDMKKNGLIVTAFVVDKVQFKISQKTQKKFAILQVSDAEEKYELPIWPDMALENSHLLEENRVLFAVVEIDIEDKIPKISCRYISDDLDPKTVKDVQKRWKKKPDKKKQEKKEVLMQLRLFVDSNQIRFTQIVQLKELFDQHPGNAPLEISFMDGPKEIASIVVDPQKGIDPHAGLSSYLKDLGFLLSMKMEEKP